jgi:hypothetical protein
MDDMPDRLGYYANTIKAHNIPKTVTTNVPNVRDSQFETVHPSNYYGALPFLNLAFVEFYLKA